MAASKPVALCTLIMPSGRVCRAVALRNQKFCRAHSTTHRIYERDRALNPILDRLGDKIAAMDTSELLFFLGSQLAQLQKTFSKYPHVRYTLTAALDRIEEITRFESDTKRQAEANHMLLLKFQELQLNSHRYAQPGQNQTLTP